MNAGRKLDRLIAETILGLRVVETDDCNGIDNLWVEPAREENDLRSFSTDIAAAWEVVEAMKSHPRGVLTLVTPTDDCIKYRAFFSKKCFENLDKYPNQIGMGNTAPHAICLAALHAVGLQ